MLWNENWGTPAISERLPTRRKLTRSIRERGFLFPVKAKYAEMPKPFEVGNQEGTKRGPNKISTKVKEAIVGFLEANVDQIQESFDQLKPGEKLKFIADILPYAAPKLQNVQNDLNASGEIKVTVTWDKEIPPSIPTP